MLACGVNGCIRKPVVDVAAVLKCLQSFKDVVLSADNCNDTDVFQSDYDAFKENCGDEHGTDDGMDQKVMGLLEKTLTKLLRSSECDWGTDDEASGDESQVNTEANVDDTRAA